LSLAYSSLPTRISVFSSSQTTVASTFSRDSCGDATSRSTRRRIDGSTSLNSIIRPNFVSSRTAR
jgi:hypothetical protein